MEIPIHRGALFVEQIIHFSGSRAQLVNDAKGTLGFYEDETLSMAPNYPLDNIYTYWHEVGHYMSEKYSFKDRQLLDGRPKNALTFDDIKKDNSWVYMQSDELDLLNKYLRDWNLISFDNSQRLIANKFLKKFFLGKYKDNDLKVKTYENSRDMTNAVIQYHLRTLPSETQTTNLNTPRYRSIELGAYMTQFGCRLLFENTLVKYRIIDKNQDIVFDEGGSPYHQRAINIIAKAYNGTGWRIPSMVDLSRT